MNDPVPPLAFNTIEIDLLIGKVGSGLGSPVERAAAGGSAGVRGEDRPEILEERLHETERDDLFAYVSSFGPDGNPKK